MSDRRIDSLLQANRPDAIGPQYGRVSEGMPGGSDGGQAQGIFAVKVWRDGGVEGSKTTACTLTYTVRTLEATAIDTGGVLLGEDMRPKNRDWGTASYHYGKWKGPPASGGGVVGQGYEDGAGTFVLYSASERRATSDECS